MAGRGASPRPPREGNRRGRETRQRVIETTLDLITEGSVNAVRISEIAERTGMTSGHVMYHFGTREEILAAALWASEESTSAALARQVDELDSPVEQLGMWIAGFLPADEHDANWKLWMHFWLARTTGEEPPPSGEAIESVWRGPLLEILEGGRQAGVFHLEDAPRFANWFHKLLLGVGLAILLGWMSASEGHAMAKERASVELRCPELIGSSSPNRLN